MAIGRAVLVRWYRRNGEKVRAGDPLCELETEQATVDVTAWADGALRQLAREGDPVEPNGPVAVIEE